jgi:hypothetical protein
MQSLELSSSGVSRTSSGARGGIMYAQRCVVVGIMLATLGGCVALSDGPERVYTVNDQVSYMRENWPIPVPTPADAASQGGRNSFVTGRMYLIDLEFNPYFARLTTQAEAGNLAGDTAIVATTFLATVLASSATKTALSAAATGLASVRTDISQDVLLSHTIQLLQLQMETSRNHIRARIQQNLQACSLTEYTVWQALSDVEDYYRAGTLSGALEALAAATGNNSQQSKDVQNGQTQTSTPTPTTAGQAPVVTLAAPQAATAIKCIANNEHGLFRARRRQG